MKKYVSIIVVALVVVCLVACGKRDKNRSEYEDIDHVVKPIEVNITVIPTDTPTPTITPTFEISSEDILNSYHREENVIEVEFDIVCAIAYSEPYSGKALGYLVGECFTTEDLYWADHNSRVGFNASCIKGLYKTDENGIIHPIEFNDDDGIIWVRDHEAVFTIVPHPENYDGSDWGQ